MIKMCECRMEDQRICDAEEKMGGCPYYRDMRLFDGKKKVEKQKKLWAAKQ